MGVLMQLRWLALLLACGALAGCGTTRWSDTSRTATEQLLVSDSIDRAVSRVDLRAVAGKKVYLDNTPIQGMVDHAYLSSAIKQHVLASGGILKEKKEDADYVLELRAGAVGTDRHDLLFGIPALTVPTVAPVTGVPNQIPEIPFVKKTEQRGVTRISLHVYNAKTGRPLWQSGAIAEESRAKDVWIFGTGPFQRGTIRKGTRFAGDRFSIPLIDLDKERDGKSLNVSIADEAFFVEPKEKDAGKTELAKDAANKDAGNKDAAKTDASQPATKDGKEVASKGAAPAAKDANAAAAPAAPGSSTPVVPAGHSSPTSPATGPSPQSPSAGTSEKPAMAAGASAVPATSATPNSGPGNVAPAPVVPPNATMPEQIGPILRSPMGELPGEFPAPRAAQGDLDLQSSYSPRTDMPAASRVIRLPPVSPFDDPPPEMAERSWYVPR